MMFCDDSVTYPIALLYTAVMQPRNTTMFRCLFAQPMCHVSNMTHIQESSNLSAIRS